MFSTSGLLISACLWNLFHNVLLERMLGEDANEFSFDGLPGAQHEFKVEVAANQEECFVQRVAQSANLHASFEVGVLCVMTKNMP